jgi:hypothetical protein
LTGKTTLGTFVQQALGRPDAAWILLSNAIPIAGVLFLGWPALSLLLFYWMETVVIGGINALKIALAGAAKPNPMASVTLVLVPFFCFHYGLFCYVHGVFVLAMFGGAQGAADDPVAFVWQSLETDADLRLTVTMLVAVHAAWFLLMWVLPGRWRAANPMVQMMEPYGRIIVLHITIFVAAIPVLLLGQPWIAIAALAVLKTLMELGLPLFAVRVEPPSPP